jgi:hypothetical protein
MDTLTMGHYVRLTGRVTVCPDAAGKKGRTARDFFKIDDLGDSNLLVSVVPRRPRIGGPDVHR